MLHNLGRCAILLTVAWAVTTSTAHAQQLPAEFQGRWDLASTYAGMWNSCWDVPEERQMQAYLDGDQAIFWGSDLWGADAESIYEFSLTAESNEGWPKGSWFVDIVSTTGAEAHLVNGCGSPIMMLLMDYTITEGECVVCPNPPCLVMDAMRCEDEPVGIYVRPASTDGERLPVSVLKSRY